MCDLAWTVLADRIREAHRYADDGPESAVGEFRDMLDEPLASVDPNEQLLRRLLHI